MMARPSSPLAPTGPPAEERQGETAGVHTVVGCLAGAANIFTGFPLDTVKVRLQAQRGQYAGAWDCFRKIVRNEGPRALFRGLLPPVLGGAAETGVNYVVYNSVSVTLASKLPSEAPLPAVAVAAAAAGAALSPVLSPAELVKCRMQAGHDLHASSWSCFMDGLRTEGWRFLFRGLPSTAMREIPGNSIYFTSYEALQRTFGVRRGALGPRSEQTAADLARDIGLTVLCGGTAGMLMWLCVLPIDICKSRVQVARAGDADDRGALWHCRRVIQESGYRGFYAGLMPVMLRAFPANACQWLTWELVMRYVDPDYR